MSAYGKLHDWQQALAVLDGCQEADKFKALTGILTTWAESKNPKLIPPKKDESSS
jgi:hypothetical protein